LNEGAASVAAGNAADSTIHGFYWLLRTSVNMAWAARSCQSDSCPALSQARTRAR